MAELSQPLVGADAGADSTAQQVVGLICLIQTAELQPIDRRVLPVASLARRMSRQARAMAERFNEVEECRCRECREHCYQQIHEAARPEPDPRPNGQRGDPGG